ncbi:transcriptional regulator, AraC family with amidase-like domain [Cupriavidus sp. YR651]|uniref:GlxA family transcriptional regulator n=1 Tax=Cupriavidus sp. YR651 TaxID=1855315 RepID=UPI00088908DD|nr:GlxA family transcriptional regulator [Cupriavidus sp. YR651]SDC62875.1 transcriptional regulator, AraC family with amidase-like domain [Cupriavidus sp. YR651]
MKIAVLAFPQVQMLDLVGPIDVFAEAARQAGNPDAYEFEIVSPVSGPLTASNGMRITPDTTLDTSSPDIDTLLIAGSPEVRLIEQDPAIRAWLHRYARSVRRLGSVCSGALLLANAGLLEGKRVTTHWNSTARLAGQFPGVRVEPDQIYVKDGNLYTSAGVTAGLDLALAMVEEDFGRAIALKVAREFVMFLKRPGGQSQFSAHLAAQVAQKGGIRDVQNWILENLNQPLTVDGLAARAGMSTRNFARIFKRESLVTPAEFVESSRVEAARRLLEETRNPLKRVASLTGFSDPNGMRRAFLRQLNVSPADYRARFRGA